MNSSAFLAAIVESSSDAIVGKTLNGTVRSWNAAADRMFGYRADEIVGRSIRLLIPEDRQSEEDRILATVVRGERIEPFETVRLKKDGHELRVSVTVSPVRDATGHVIAASKIARDITEQANLRDQLEVTRERFNLLADNISQLAWIADGSGWIFWYNKRWYEYTGTTLEQMQGWGWKDVHHPEHVDRVVRRISHSWETGESWEDTFPLRGANGQYRWFLSRARPIRDVSGKLLYWFGTNTDVTAQRIAEDRNEVLLAELAHRSKNLMTLVQSLARRTAAQGGDFINELDERIAGLAATQDLLVRRNWGSIPVLDMIRAQLRFVGGNERRIQCAGPDIFLSASAAECLSMAIHELSTNALKYGALSVEAGHVEIDWDVTDYDSSPKSEFQMQWREVGGPPVAQPQKLGFGSQLVTDVPRLQLAAKAAVDYAKDGLRWRLAAPVSNVLAIG
jgi:PAS domain S-box-containing protein